MLSNFCLRQGWVLFTIGAIANAEGNTPAIEQTAFLSLKPPRKLFAMAVFVVLARSQLRHKRSNKLVPKNPVSVPLAKNFNFASWKIV
ncbi:MAG: hypothetical protein ICV80_01640 [Microcoleus sp. T1-bin1]|nr:hypothetical protein [Microcoleus sp. T1-bin1]